MSRGGVVCALEFLRYGVPIYRNIVLHLCREIGNTLCGMCTAELSFKLLLRTWCLKSSFVALMYVFTHFAVLRIKYTSCSLNWFGSQECFLLFCVWKVIEVKNLALDSVAIAVKCLDCESHACCHLWVAVPLPQSFCLPKTGVLHHQMSGGIHWSSLRGLFSKFGKNLVRMSNLKQGSVSQGLVTLRGKCLNSSLFIVVEFLPVYITVEDLLKIIFWLCKCLSSFRKFIFYEMTLDTFLPSVPCSNKSTLSQTVCILTLFLISAFVRNNTFSMLQWQYHYILTSWPCFSWLSALWQERKPSSSCLADQACLPKVNW